MAFYKCSALHTIYAFNPEPLSLSGLIFDTAIYAICDLYVPEGSRDAYAAANIWKEFVNIHEFDPTGIESVTANDKIAAGKSQHIYDLNGRRLTAPKAGINIIGGKKVVIRK